MCDFFRGNVCMSLQEAAIGKCFLWYSLLQGKPSLAFPCAQRFSIVACCLRLVESRISQSSCYLLKLLCQSNVIMPGWGNFFQCVIEVYGNCPFSISTVDVFILLDVRMSFSLLFCIREISPVSPFEMLFRNEGVKLLICRGLLDAKLWFGEIKGTH